jgi:plastocyanin
MRTHPKVIALSMAAAALALVLAACGSSTASAPAAQSAGGVATAAGPTLTIADFAFSPLTVKAGETVTVVNSDSVDHTVTLATANLDVNVPGGGSATFTAPATPGDYALTCDFHPSMKGTLTVTS